MDEQTVRDAATQHAEATVAKDFKTAGATLTKPAMAQAGDVMKAMPGDLSGCEIASVTSEGDEMVVAIVYRGAEGETTVQSRWAEVDGRPMITDLQV